MPNFFRVLEEFPCAMVVISSDWREELTDRDYIQLFGQYHSRIIGITPRIKFARREIEILQYVKNAQISQFIAIDDDCRDELFSYKCPWLFKTDFNNGLDLLATEKLLQFINDKLIKIES
ncbi:MAG: hypothetical protein K2Y14_01180 [Burkholderiales bacterium]|nr:hypothetical protein [Burkholderiales bacterium]